MAPTFAAAANAKLPLSGTGPMNQKLTAEEVDRRAAETLRRMIAITSGSHRR